MKEWETSHEEEEERNWWVVGLRKEIWVDENVGPCLLPLRGIQIASLPPASIVGDVSFTKTPMSCRWGALSMYSFTTTTDSYGEHIESDYLLAHL